MDAPLKRHITPLRLDFSIHVFADCVKTLMPATRGFPRRKRRGGPAAGVAVTAVLICW